MPQDYKCRRTRYTMLRNNQNQTTLRCSYNAAEQSKSDNASLHFVMLRNNQNQPTLRFSFKTAQRDKSITIKIRFEKFRSIVNAAEPARNAAEQSKSDNAPLHL